jgi:hypothetical protein
MMRNWIITEPKCFLTNKTNLVLMLVLVDNLLETPSGILLIMAGGWLDEVETCLLLAFGLMKGLIGEKLVNNRAAVLPDQ